MAKIAAIIIAKNAETMIADCIDSISFCDEIIVIDSGSSDRTPDIAKHLGAKVFSFLTDDFSQKRNYALRKIKSKWILYIDTDERVSKELKTEIENIVKEDKTTVAAYKLRRKNFYFGKYEWPQVEKLERFFKKTQLKEWRGELHETAEIIGETGELEGVLMHYSHQDLSSMLDKTIRWSKTEAELRIKVQHPQMSWWRFFRVMFTAFYDSYIKQKGYSVGTAGLIESMYQAFSILITYARLWELQNRMKSKNEK